MADVQVTFAIDRALVNTIAAHFGCSQTQALVKIKRAYRRAVEDPFDWHYLIPDEDPEGNTFVRFISTEENPDGIRFASHGEIVESEDE